MKLTKEECRFALNDLYGRWLNQDNNAMAIEEDMVTLEQLIEEHFDNAVYIEKGKMFKLFKHKPLKFEELKEGMWVWDNKYKDYVKFKRHDIENFGKLIIFSKGFDEEYLRKFEENSFYRREVEQ